MCKFLFILLICTSCASIPGAKHANNSKFHVKTVHLSFDDGPSPTYTSPILSYLKEQHIKANFFLVGEMVNNSPELVKEEIADGHNVGGHSMTHKELTKIRLDSAKSEISESMKLVNQFQHTDLFRFPYGSSNEGLRRYARDNGYRVIYWNIDTEDWKYPQKEEIFKKFKDQIEKSSDCPIILMHDIHPQTLGALKMIVEYLKEHKIAITKIDQ